MAEDLQNLIERIQKDAVEKADAQSAEIIAKAKAEAASIIKNAETEAKAKLEKADKDAEVYTERSNKALEQAARDVLISVGRRLESMVNGILSLQVEKNLNDSTIKEMLLLLAKNYASSEMGVVFSAADKAKLESFVIGQGSRCRGSGRKRFGHQVRIPPENGRWQSFSRIYFPIHCCGAVGASPPTGGENRFRRGSGKIVDEQCCLHHCVASIFKVRRSTSIPYFGTSQSLFCGHDRRGTRHFRLLGKRRRMRRSFCFGIHGS